MQSRRPINREYSRAPDISSDAPSAGSPGSTIRYQDHYLTKLLLNTEEFRNTLFSMLTASEISSMLVVFRVWLSVREARYFLNPLRDISWMHSYIHCADFLGYTPFLVGMGVYDLITRIRDPRLWWSTPNPKRRITLWMVLVDNNKRTLEKQSLALQAFDSIEVKQRLLLDNIDTIEMYDGDGIETSVIVRRPHDSTHEAWLAQRPVGRNDAVATLYPSFHANRKFFLQRSAFVPVGMNCMSTGVMDLTQLPLRATSAVTMRIPAMRGTYSDPIHHTVEDSVAGWMAYQSRVEFKVLEEEDTGVGFQIIFLLK